VCSLPGESTVDVQAQVFNNVRNWKGGVVQGYWSVLILIFHLWNQVCRELRCSWRLRDAVVGLSLEERMALSSVKEAMIVEGCRGMSAVYTVPLKYLFVR
jgi:hypothetical protein